MITHLRWYRDTPWGAQIARIVFTLSPAEHRAKSVLAAYRKLQITVMEDPDAPGELLVHVRGPCHVTRSVPPSAAEAARMRSCSSKVFAGFGPGEPTHGTGGAKVRR